MKRVPVLYMVVILFSVIISGQFASAAQSPLTLHQAILMALEHGAVSKTASIDKSLAELNAADAVASYFPHVDAKLSGAISGSQEAEPQVERTSQAGIQVSQLILDGGERQLKSRLAEISLDLATVQERTQLDQQILDVIRAFLEFSAAQVALVAHQEIESELRKQSEDSLKFMQQGVRPPIDHQRMLTELQRQNLTVTKALDSLVYLRSKLCATIGIADQDVAQCPEFEPVAAKSKLEFDPAHITTIPGEGTQLVRRFELELDALSEQTAGFRRERWLPKVSLDGHLSYGVSNFWGTDQANYDRGTWSLQLTATYPLWDQHTLRRKIQSTVLRHQRKSLEFAQAVKDRQIEVDSLVRALKQAVTTFELSTKIYDMDKNTYRRAQTEYRQGRMSYLDMIDARSKWMQSRIGLAQAYFESSKKYWEYRFYRGDIKDAIEKI